MAKPRKIHTIESLYANTYEYGDCKMWQGYMANGVPMVYHKGGMYSVRKLLIELTGAIADRDYFVCSCGECSCIAIEHIVQLRKTEHYRRMNKESAKTAKSPLRIAKIVEARRKLAKLTPNQMAEIRLSQKTGKQLAKDYGVSETRVSQVKRQTEPGNVWAGLM